MQIVVDLTSLQVSEAQKSEKLAETLKIVPPFILDRTY
jgi:hypothetical protein